jgi:hypothetical protein
MYILLLLPIVYAAAVLDTLLGNVLHIGSVAPDLLAMTAVVWILVAAGPRAFCVAGMIALVGDLIAPGQLGIGTAWMLLIGYGLCRLRGYFVTGNLPLRVLAVWVAVTLWAIGVGLSGYLLSGYLLGQVATPVTTVLCRAAGVGVYTAALSLPLLMVIGWIRESRFLRQPRLNEA